MAKLSGSLFDVRQQRPDFVVHIAVNDNTTARLFAYRDVGSAVSGDGFMAAGDKGRQVRVPSTGLGFMLNTSSHNAVYNPVLAPSMTEEDYDATGF